MPLHSRIEEGTVILSNLGRLMNDPRYSSAGGEIQAAIDAGHRCWILELADVREAGAPLLGLLMTLTRRIRRAGGAVVLARVSPSLLRCLEEMRLEDHWDLYDSVNEAQLGLRSRCT